MDNNTSSKARLTQEEIELLQEAKELNNEFLKVLDKLQRRYETGKPVEEDR